MLRLPFSVRLGPRLVRTRFFVSLRRGIVDDRSFVREVVYPVLLHRKVLASSCTDWSRRSSTRGQEEDASTTYSASGWSAFCEEWNGALTRHPAPMVIFFSGCCTLSWATILSVVSTNAWATSALAAPEFAVGWLVMRATRKFRIPLNMALAAPISHLFPWFSQLRIAPLLTAFVADAKTRESSSVAVEHVQDALQLREATRAHLRVVWGKVKATVRRLEGPVDTFGLSFFVATKATNVATLGLATWAAAHGLDVSGALTHWGFSTELQGNAGLFACSAAINTLCTPLHFYGAVRVVTSLEKSAAATWHVREMKRVEEVINHAGEHYQARHRLMPFPQGDFVHALVAALACACVMFDLAFSLYLVRRLSQAQFAQAVEWTPEPKVSLTDRDVLS